MIDMLPAMTVPERVLPAPLCIRHGSMGDLPFIEDAWSKAAVKSRGGPMGERWVEVDGERLRLAPNEWHEMRRERIRGILGRSGVLVGHRVDAPDVVWAWLVFDLSDAPGMLLLHWVWTRPELRRRGYASKLLDEAHRLRGPCGGLRYVRCSHMTAAGEAFLGRVQP